MSNKTEPSIVERLRHSAAVNRSGGYDGDAEEREEAAREIERLLTEQSYLLGRFGLLIAERECLRGTLERIAADCQRVTGESDKPQHEAEHG